MGGLTLNIEITLNNWINSLNTTSSLDIRVAPATRTRGEGGRRPPSPLVYIIYIRMKLGGSVSTRFFFQLYRISSYRVFITGKCTLDNKQINYQIIYIYIYIYIYILLH